MYGVKPPGQPLPLSHVKGPPRGSHGISQIIKSWLSPDEWSGVTQYLSGVCCTSLKLVPPCLLEASACDLVAVCSQATLLSLSFSGEHKQSCHNLPLRHLLR